MQVAYIIVFHEQNQYSNEQIAGELTRVIFKLQYAVHEISI